MKRGSELPWSKLSESDIRLIFACVDERNKLRDQANQLSNESLAIKFGVHIRTIEKVISGVTWGHVL